MVIREPDGSYTVKWQGVYVFNGTCAKAWAHYHKLKKGVKK